MIWFTSDLHFGHENVIGYCKRPFASLLEMEIQLECNWNEHIRPEDTVYIVGDLSFCSFRQFRAIGERLKGRKFLIKGNHDHYSDGQYAQMGITVFHELKLKLCGQTVRLSHYPYAYPWWRRPFAFKSELRYMELRPPKIKGEFLIHGHTHTKYRESGNRIHVGVDAWDYRPVSLTQIESILSKKVKR